MTPWLTVRRGDAPLIVSFPHTGTEIPAELESRLVSPWIARKDADWWIDKLYAFAADLGATTIHTAISRTVIDVNRNPAGTTLYPGQQTTELCPTTTFDGEPLYKSGAELVPAEIAERRTQYFDPYHARLEQEIVRLRQLFPTVAVYDCHSIRSVIPRLFDGELPNFNIGTNSGASCDPALTAGVEAICAKTGFTHVTNGRFTGGWITRRHGDPKNGVHTIQMELACRGYMPERLGPVAEGEWPASYDPTYAQPMRDALEGILKSCLSFAHERNLS
ncbi:N-formylglutamate deformylase [Bradyrhizobium sp. Ash2021]|uniref:N-formylglutamate deformylase n=1 Tax=Bradyrhizobium sp. Ash2021 TaxID=2954771 RepID=UPI0028155B0C|nr:N-formylglutamate deformylase [Bradyrhizobium sp. Ash2021]WMT75967.1 N-formylglutamate deformylase [Bradyrhizobium sp. Ash2021]